VVIHRTGPENNLQTEKGILFTFSCLDRSFLMLLWLCCRYFKLYSWLETRESTVYSGRTARMFTCHDFGTCDKTPKSVHRVINCGPVGLSIRIGIIIPTWILRRFHSCCLCRHRAGRRLDRSTLAGNGIKWSWTSSLWKYFRKWWPNIMPVTITEWVCLFERYCVRQNTVQWAVILST
jgi:hypothetical protein